MVICKRKSFITSCLDETTVQMKKRRKRRRRKSSFTHSQISFESFNSQRIRERIRRRNYLKKGNLSPRRVVEISGQPISNWKKDDLLGLYDLVDCDRTGRPVYKVKCLLLSTLWSLGPKYTEASLYKETSIFESFYDNKRLNSSSVVINL